MAAAAQTDTATLASNSDITLSHLFGECTWLLTQSPIHREMGIKDLDWLLMPALLLGQVYVFRDGDRPVGLALWAYCSAEAAAKLENGIDHGSNAFTAQDWKSGDELWLVDLVAPFANLENKQREIMLLDLIYGPLKDQTLKFHHTDLKTAARSSVRITPEFAATMKAELETALAAQTTTDTGTRH
jgi:cytolysin-activating lysine-acyltransferase